MGIHAYEHTIDRFIIIVFDLVLHLWQLNLKLYINVHANTVSCQCFIIFIAPIPVVVSSVNTTGRIFESTDVSLLCNVTVAPLDVESVVNLTWFEPNGMIKMNETHYSLLLTEVY